MSTIFGLLAFGLAEFSAGLLGTFLQKEINIVNFKEEFQSEKLLLTKQIILFQEKHQN